MGKSGKQTKASSKEQEQQSQEESSPYGKFTCMKKHVAFRYKCCFHDTKLAALSLSLSLNMSSFINPQEDMHVVVCGKGDRWGGVVPTLPK